jgi:hypothetical protein
MSTLPTVHLNGTSCEMLIEGYETAYRKLIKFKHAFNTLEFNARDYYVAEPDAWSKACDEREKMMNNVKELLEYFEAHLIHLADDYHDFQA